MNDNNDLTGRCDNDACGHQELRHVGGRKCRMLACPCRQFKAVPVFVVPPPPDRLEGEERDGEIVALHVKGVSRNQISIQLDCASSVVDRVIRRYRLQQDDGADREDVA